MRAKTRSKSVVRLDQVMEVEAVPPVVSMEAALVFHLVVEIVAVDGGGAAGAPGLAVDVDEAGFRGGHVAAASANEDGAVDEGKLVVFLEEDDQAVCKLNALGLLGLELRQRRDGNLLPRLCWSVRSRRGSGWCGSCLCIESGGRKKSADGEHSRYSP